MPIRTNVDQRRLFCQQHENGSTYEEIAAEYGCSKECVRYWCRRQRDRGNLETQYSRRPGKLLSHFDVKVRYVILRLKLEHHRWGPSRILFHLAQRTSVKGMDYPSTAQIGRYLHQWERFRRKRTKRPYKRQLAATKVQQRWMIDFKMGIQLANGEQVNMHTICDPVGEVCLVAQVYPAGKCGNKPWKVKPEEVRQTVRHCAAKVGYLPSEIQTDGETNLVATRGANDFPTNFTLWLVSLGIQHLVIRPGRPTDNSEVERFHRTVNDYAIVARTLPPDIITLQVTLDQALDELASKLPSHAHDCHGLPPLQAHPDLLVPKRLYSPQTELSLCDWEQVKTYLSSRSWKRVVGKSGQVWLGGHTYSLNRRDAGKIVLIRFDPSSNEMVFCNPKDVESEIRRLPAQGLSLNEILNPNTLAGTQQLPLPAFEIFLHKGYVIKEQKG